MDEERNEKGKKSISKRGLVLGLSAILLAGAAAAGFAFANQRDAKEMETGMEQVAVQNSSLSITPVSTESAKADEVTPKQEETSKELWLDQHKIMVNSENPTNVTIQAKDAAKIALENIEKDTKQMDDDCQLELFHLYTAGTGKSTGIWSVVTVLNDMNRYEFRINDSTGEVIQRDDYVMAGNKFTWIKDNSKEMLHNETIINEQKLAAFSKIDAEEINVAECEIVEGKDYGIYIKYNSEQQTASYENKNGTLTVKVERIKNAVQKNVNAHITITVPKGTKFDSIVYHSGVGNFSMGDFVVKSLKLNQNCGDVQLKGTSYENAEVSANCGDATFSGCIMKDTKLSADCGSISLTDCTMTNTDANANCGNIDIKNSNMVDSKMKANCGVITGVNLVSKNLTLSADYGSIEVVGDLIGTNDITAFMGCIAVGCTKDKSKYSYILSAKSGSVIIDNKIVGKDNAQSQNSLAENTIKASAEMGNCTVMFQADPKVPIQEPEIDYDSWDYEDSDYYDDDNFDFMNDYFDDFF